MIKNKKAESEGGMGSVIIKAVLLMALFSLLALGLISFLKKFNVF